MAHPLAGFLDAKAERGRRVVVMRVNGEKAYFAGACGFTTEKEAATRFAKTPLDVLAQFPDAWSELA